MPMISYTIHMIIIYISSPNFSSNLFLAFLLCSDGRFCRQPPILKWRALIILPYYRADFALKFCILVKEEPSG